MIARLVVLGSGTSFGVPVIGCSCDVCHSADPRDRRTRVSALVESVDGDRLLIDTPPELRLQLAARGVDTVDAVAYTHDHADHLHGIDDLRAVSMRKGTVPVYGPPDTLKRIRARFDYIFDPDVVPNEQTSLPSLTLHPLEAGVETRIGGLSVLPLEFPHGHGSVYGYRFGPAAYLTDVKSVAPDAVAKLRGVRVLVLNALFEKPHPAHLSIPEAIQVARAIGAERTYLTHLTHRYAHETLLSRLPDGIEPAYDGLTVAI